ncbi:hypothetical protein PVIIG_06239 [Plasmodium vivax India VII]|uniref:Variable surface protein Vir4 n=1 Tax=Plasmodium vivax India VII TaxID=1077284 RepID=A0A0J9S2B2_PLAVI|nr:hypothetical protein PVIIG_06239 [Plasmodium vivax India VII]
MMSIKEKEWNELDVRNFLIAHGLYTGNFYEDLETSSTSSRYDIYCGSPEKPMRDSRDVRNICATILNYLEFTYSASDHTTDAYDVCKLLNYWVYKRLNVVLHSKKSKYINQTHGDIVRKWNTFNDYVLKNPKNKTCKPIGNIVVYNDWEKRKELYEYYVDYNQIKQYLQIYPKKCKEFYKYIESKKKLYEHFKKDCPSDDINRCPEFYEQCKQYDPEEVLPHIHCYDVEMQETATAASRLPQLRKGLLDSETESEETNGPMRTFDAPKLSGKSQSVENVGGMIRNGLGWNNNNMRNFNGGDIGLYDYASEPFNPYPGEEHYIGYHPA